MMNEPRTFAGPRAKAPWELDGKAAQKEARRRAQGMQRAALEVQTAERDAWEGIETALTSETAAAPRKSFSHLAGLASEVRAR